MKIEICEQMIQSWLLHIKQCQIVQTNWTISPLLKILPSDINDAYNFVISTQDLLNKTLQEEYLKALQESIDEEEKEGKKKKVKKFTGLDIIKKNKAEQFMRQCEVDVVGIRLGESKVDRVFLIDSAFHKNGLGYHDVVATVVKKIIRAIVVSKVIFGDKIDITVGFASPECKPTPKAEILKVVNILKTITAVFYPNVFIEVYFNEDFAKEIYLPLKNNVEQLNNDNDLFIRSLNISVLAENRLKEIDSTKKATLSPKSSKKTNKLKSKPSGHEPVIVYNPSDINVFKTELLKSKRAEITYYYKDGTVSIRIWKADKLMPSSNINQNVKTSHIYKRDKDILVKIELKVL